VPVLWLMGYAQWLFILSSWFGCWWRETKETLRKATLLLVLRTAGLLLPQPWHKASLFKYS